jgi:hypothetical protein
MRRSTLCPWLSGKTFNKILTTSKGVNTMYNFDRHPNLVLKLNVPFALEDGEKIALDYAPARKADGTVLVPAFIITPSRTA